MICKNCKNSIDNDQIFCPFCGFNVSSYVKEVMIDPEEYKELKRREVRLSERVDFLVLQNQNKKLGIIILVCSLIVVIVIAIVICISTAEDSYSPTYKTSSYTVEEVTEIKEQREIYKKQVEGLKEEVNSLKQKLEVAKANAMPTYVPTPTPIPTPIPTPVPTLIPTQEPTDWPVLLTVNDVFNGDEDCNVLDRSFLASTMQYLIFDLSISASDDFSDYVGKWFTMVIIDPHGNLVKGTGGNDYTTSFAIEDTGHQLVGFGNLTPGVVYTSGVYRVAFWFMGNCVLTYDVTIY